MKKKFNWVELGDDNEIYYYHGNNNDVDDIGGKRNIYISIQMLEQNFYHPVLNDYYSNLIKIKSVVYKLKNKYHPDRTLDLIKTTRNSKIEQWIDLHKYSKAYTSGSHIITVKLGIIDNYDVFNNNGERPNKNTIIFRFNAEHISFDEVEQQLIDTIVSNLAANYRLKNNNYEKALHSRLFYYLDVEKIRNGNEGLFGKNIKYGKSYPRESVTVEDIICPKCFEWNLHRIYPYIKTDVLGLVNPNNKYEIIGNLHPNIDNIKYMLSARVTKSYTANRILDEYNINFKKSDNFDAFGVNEGTVIKCGRAACNYKLNDDNDDRIKYDINKTKRINNFKGIYEKDSSDEQNWREKMLRCGLARGDYKIISNHPRDAIPRFNNKKAKTAYIQALFDINYLSGIIERGNTVFHTDSRNTKSPALYNFYDDEIEITKFYPPNQIVFI